MTRDDLQEALEAFAPRLDHLVAEAIRKHFARQRRNVDPVRLALQDVPEVLKVAVAAPDRGEADLEGGNVGLYVQGSANKLGSEQAEEQEILTRVTIS